MPEHRKEPRIYADLTASAPSISGDRRPRRRRGLEGRARIGAVVGLVVAAGLVAPVDEGLEVEGDIGIGLTERHQADRQALPERGPEDLDLVGSRRPPHTGLAGRPARRGKAIRRKEEDALTPPRQVDLDNAGICRHGFLPLPEVEHPAIAGDLVRGAQELDQGHNLAARAGIDDPDRALGDRLVSHLDHEGLRSEHIPPDAPPDLGFPR